MLFKLSTRNVKRSIKEYSIYFFTLALGICIFYVFNSIESQTIMMDLSNTQKIFLDALNDIISLVSVFVSFVLGFLIIYANNFLIKRRSKEFGIYMTLGISRTKIAFMLFYETVIVGGLSLVTGIFVGVFLSQSLAGITAKLFAINMTKYQFIFSKDSCIKTIIYFTIIYIITMILNFIVVSRCKLINLINSQRNNEKLKGTSLVISVVLFIVSIICLVLAYKIILKNGLLQHNRLILVGNEFNLSIILGILGTVLFFRALAGFLIKVTQSNKNQYLKNLNTFTLRQLNSKINTNYVSMSVICLMLFISIGMYSASIGIKSALENTAKFSTPYDMTMSDGSFGEVNSKSINRKKINEVIKNLGFDINDYAKEYIAYSFYNSPIKFVDTFKNISDEFFCKQVKEMKNFNIPILKLSDYNKLNKMQNKKTIDLKDNEVLFLTDVSSMKNAMEEYVNETDTLKIGKDKFKVCKNYEYQAIENGMVNGNLATLIVQDKYVSGYDLNKQCLSLNYKGEKIATEKDIMEKLESLESEGEKYEKHNNIKINAMTRIIALESSMASSAMYLYVGLYIGLIFLITSAAVLGLSQLSGATESLGRYEILRKLGVSSKMIDRSIFIQVFLYFSLPILLALVHSIFGIKVANDVVRIFGDFDTLGNNIFVITSICVVYGIYLFGTYKGYKRIVNK